MIETENNIFSNDGTKIGYRQIGSGHGLIIVHGTGRISQNYRKLAHSLADSYTVFTYDRRGRGLSGSLTDNHNIAKEIEDLITLIKATKAKYVFGHSFGGVISLQTAIKVLEIKKLAVYEPSISIENSISSDWLPEFEKAISKNKKVKAMTIFLKALPPPDIRKFPNWALTLLVLLVKFLERKKDDKIKMLNLLYTIPADMRIVKLLESSFELYQNIVIPTLLMSGTKSQVFFQESVKALGKTISHSQIKIFDNFDHYSPEEKVQEISMILKDYFR